MLSLALVLDALFGEPDWLWRRVPHPAVLMGHAVDALDSRLNNGKARRAKGVAALAILAAGVVAIALILSWPGLHGVFEVVFAAILIAQRSLSDHVLAVASGLERSLADGRRAVSLIVGRDPENLDESGTARAAVESAAENWSDGVVAPAFWFLLAGLPGIALYKAINTADSMIGHRTERHEEFGWAAARLDDAMNWLPARLSGLAICLVHGGVPAIRTMVRDAGKHRSPNAGWPESAVAASLGIALAGPRSYGGIPTRDPFLNAEGRHDLTADDIRRSMALLWRAWLALLAVTVLAESLLYVL